MKKTYTLITLLFIIACLTIAPTNSFAQEGDITIGVGLAFGSGVFDDTGSADINNDLGIRVDGVYTINEEFRGAVDFVYYFPKEESGVKITVWELNFNGNYLFHSDEEATLYALAGLNITGLKTTFESDGFGSFSGSDSEVGLNIGAGGEYAMNFGALFAEVKYVISNADQLAIAAGARFDI